MKINGFKLQLILKQLNSTRDLVQAQFPETLWRFEGESKASPDEVAAQFQKLEVKLAKAQTAQVLFNTRVFCEVMGERMTLAEAVKRIGGAGRYERLWKQCVKKKDTPRWARSDDAEKKREKDATYAAPTITSVEILQRVKKASQQLAALKEAIAIGNAKEFELSELGLTADLIE